MTFTGTASPYGDAAWAYRRAGWQGVIPVGYGRRRKSPPFKGFTGWAGADPSGPDVQTWVDGPEAHWNIGLHLPTGIVVPDVDAYNGGDRTLARLEASVGHPLPPTWSSTSKGQGSPSRHRFYRADLPEGRVWHDHPGGIKSGIDALHVGHRYAVVWPSIHPSGDGYFWYDPDGELWEGVPSPNELTVLDDAWVTELSKVGTPLPGTAADDVTTWATVHRFRRGPQCRRVARQLAAELDRIAGANDRESAGGLHSPGPLYALTALGLEGHAGVNVALSIHQAAYVAARVQYRGETDATADGDWWRMFRGAVGKKLVGTGGHVAEMCDCDAPAAGTRERSAVGGTSPLAPARQMGGVDVDEVTPGPAPAGDMWAGFGATPPADGEIEPYAGTSDQEDPGDDEGFWSSRPILAHIRAVALGQYAAPWATLGVVLAHVVAATSPVVQLPATVGGYGSLNLFVALVARSGGGKGAAEAAARRCIIIDPVHSGSCTKYPTHALGSGEGLAHMFMKRPKATKDAPDPEPFQYNTAALVTVAEIDTLTALQGRTGSTLAGQLRQAAMGEQLGFFYVDKDKRMPVPEHAYRLSLVAGVQPKRAAALLDESGGGTPQRFAWLPATVRMPEVVPDTPEPVLWVAPRWPVAQVVHGMARTVVTLPQVAIDRTIELRRQHLADEGDPLDGHANLVRLKVATALAILDGRCEVGEEDWKLSGVIMDVSSRTRRRIVDELAADRREANLGTAEAEAARTIVITDRVEQQARQRVAAIVRNRLGKADGDGWVTHAEVNQAVGGRLRSHLGGVIEGMVIDGSIEREEAPHRSGTGYKYRLTRR
jgi:hypothetical protein